MKGDDLVVSDRHLVYSLLQPPVHDQRLPVIQPPDDEGAKHRPQDSEVLTRVIADHLVTGQPRIWPHPDRPPAS